MNSFYCKNQNQKKRCHFCTPAGGEESISELRFNSGKKGDGCPPAGGRHDNLTCFDNFAPNLLQFFSIAEMGRFRKSLFPSDRGRTGIAVQTNIGLNELDRGPTSRRDISACRFVLERSANQKPLQNRLPSRQKFVILVGPDLFL